MKKSVAIDVKPKTSKNKGMSIESALKAFTEENLYEATKTFLEEGFGLELFSDYRGDSFNKYFDHRNINYQYVKNARKHIDNIFPIGSIILNPRIEPDRYNTIQVFACEAKKELTREEISNLTRAFNICNSENDKEKLSLNFPVIVLIRQGSYIHICTSQRSIRNDESDKIEKSIILYKINYTEPRKGHIQILEEMNKNIKKCKTFESLFQSILKSLSIDIVSDNFFKGYNKIFKKIREEAFHNAKIKKEFTHFPDPKKAIRDYVKMLMGRLVFIQFLQRKGWMGVPVGDNSWEDGDPEFIQNLYDRSSDKNHFVDRVLKPLFTDLNEKRDGDRANECYAKGLKVPYLNGGLFEMEEFAGVKFPLPQNLMEEMLEFFRSYNFTIDENSQDSVEVGVDPEMLSNIFEYLLEDNKEKGAYYTPKDVVDYMCCEALTTYLQNGTDDDAKKELYKVFVKEHNIDSLSLDDIKYLDNKLRDVKICDPAIGSGAFPMGMLKELFECRKAIEQHQGSWSASEIKKDIIQNSIYGVDIEKGAVNIARLRFWLALIIDEKTPHALPNMEFKIMQGNSLLEQFEGIDLSKLELTAPQKSNKKKGKKNKSNDLEQEFVFDSIGALSNIQKNIKQYYATDDHGRKLTLRNNINRFVKDYIKNVEGCTPSIQNKIEALEIPNDQFFLWHIYFKEVFDNGGFDIVIGNPPYIKLQDMKKMSKVYSKCGFETYNTSADIYCLFTEHGFSLLKKGGILCYIMMNKWMKTDYGKDLRRFILNHRIHRVIDYGDVQIFKKATTYPCIILLENSDPATSFMAARLKDANLENVPKQSDEFLTSKLDDDNWVLQSRGDLLLYKKLDSKFPSLVDYHKSPAKRGILSGLTDAFLISEETKNRLVAECSSATEVIEPFYEGKDIKPYESPQSSKYLILFKKGFTYELMGRTNASEDEAWTFMSARYPSVCKWLAPFAQKARNRDDKGFYWWELRSCDYYDQFNLQKIMYQTFQVKPNFVYDTKGRMCSNSMWILPTENKALLGLFNSKIGWWLLSCYCSQIQNGYQLIWDYFKRIPIALHEEDKDIADQVDKILAAKAENNDADIAEEMHEIDCRLYELYGLTNGEVKVIDPEAETFGADFEDYQRKPEFKKIKEEEIKTIYDELRKRFEKIRADSGIPIKKEGIYDLSKSGKPDKKEVEVAFQKWNCAILTAYRGKMEKINKLRNKELKEHMRKQGMLFRSVDGWYIEYGEDGTEDRTPINELSFFVTNTDVKGTEFKDRDTEFDFFKKIYRLSEHYEQDCFLFTFPGDNRVAFLVATNHYGRSDFRGNIKFSGPLFNNIEDLDAWTGCNDGKIAFILKGMIRKRTPYNKIWIGEGNIFDEDPDNYIPNFIIVLHDNKSKGFTKDCNDYLSAHPDKLFVDIFDKEQNTPEEVQVKLQAALAKVPKKCKTLGFHCSASINGSYIEGARIAYDAVIRWAEQNNRNLNKVVIVDIFGDYCKI